MKKKKYEDASLGDKERNRAVFIDEAVPVCEFLGDSVEDYIDEPEKKIV